MVNKLRKLISSRVHQSLISHFSSVDRGGWNIWRNLSLVSKRSSYIHEFQFMSEWNMYWDEPQLHKRVPQDLNPRGSVVSGEIMENWLGNCLKDHYGLPKAIEALFGVLHEHKEYQQFLPRSRIFHILKQYQNLSFTGLGEIEQAESSYPSPDTPEGDVTTDLIIDKLQTYVGDEIKTKYLDTGKIDASIFSDYAQILNAYFSDLLQDGFADKLKDYVDIQDADHLLDEDWLAHRGRLEYLIKLGKAWLRHKVRPAEFPNSRKMDV